MDGIGGHKSFGALIRYARKQLGMSQEKLGNLAGNHHKQWVNNIEELEAEEKQQNHIPLLPPINEVFALWHACEERAEELRAKGEISAHAPDAGLVLLTWIQSNLGDATILSDLEKARITRTIQTLARSAQGSPPFAIAGSPTLDLFPYGFGEIVVVTGSRRDRTPSPKNPGSLLALSMAPSDLTFLPALGLGTTTRVIPDSVFEILPESEIKARFGRGVTLLVVGSPAVNLVARRINNHALFRFHVGRALRTRVRRFERWAKGLSPEQFRLVSEYIGGPHQRSTEPPGGYPLPIDDVNRIRVKVDDLLGGQHPDALISQFVPQELIDLSDIQVKTAAKGVNSPRAYDTGVISFATNPWDKTDESLAILVAGLGPVGTTQALGMLADPRTLSRFPLGGVFKFEWEASVQFPGMSEPLRPIALSREYTCVDFVQRLSDESNRERLRSLGIGRVELDECRVLATRIAKGNREAG